MSIEQSPSFTTDLGRFLPASVAITSLTPTAPQSRDISNLANLIESEVPRMTGLFQSNHSLGRSAPAVCIDRGSGSGDNSQVLADAFARAVRRVSRLPIITFCNEKTPACFSQLASQTVQSQESNYGDHFVYRGMICASFLQQLLPDSSADLVTSNAALHWLDLSDSDLKDHEVGFNGKKSSREEVLKQIAAMQWRKLLEAVARELRPGGELIVSFVARPNHSLRKHVPLELLDIAIRQVMGEDFGQLGLQLAYPIPIYRRAAEEIIAPFRNRLPRRLPLTLNRCHVDASACPYFAHFQQTGDSDRYAEQLTGFIRSFSSNCLHAWLHRLGHQDSAPEMLCRIYDVIQGTVRRDPMRWQMNMHRAVVVATRD